MQSSPVIPALGAPLGTRAQMMWLEEGLPNSIAPRKRPRTTLSPTILVRDDGTVIACGTPGGDAQGQWTLEFLIRHVVDGLPLQAAVDAPTFHSLHMPLSFWPRQSRPGVVQIEEGWDADLRRDLAGRGHLVEVVPDRSQGWMCAVSSRPDGFVSASASQRGRDGQAVAR